MLMVAFLYPPNRSDIREFLGKVWRPSKDRDELWEVMLIAERWPDYPYIGKVTSVYGVIECREKDVVDNTPATIADG